MLSPLKSLAAVVALSLAALLGVLPAPSVAQPADTSAKQSELPLPPPPTVSTSKEVVDNPYGLKALWAQGDFVAKGTLIVLVIMSLGSWYIIVTKLYESLKISSEAKATRRRFFNHQSLVEAAKTLKEGSAFRFIAETGIVHGQLQAPLVCQVQMLFAGFAGVPLATSKKSPLTAVR